MSDQGPARLRGRTEEQRVVRRIGDETLVYDRLSDRAHCLNRTAAVVFEGLAQGRSAGDLVRHVETRLGLPPPEARALLEDALDQLREAELMDGVPDPGPGRLPYRRSALRALVSAGLAPLVLSITAPTPAEALTCLPRNASCTSSQQCCPDAPCCRVRGNRATCSPGGGACLP